MNLFLKFYPGQRSTVRVKRFSYTAPASYQQDVWHRAVLIPVSNAINVYLKVFEAIINYPYYNERDRLTSR